MEFLKRYNTQNVYTADATKRPLFVVDCKGAEGEIFSEATVINLSMRILS